MGSIFPQLQVLSSRARRHQTSVRFPKENVTCTITPKCALDETASARVKEPIFFSHFTFLPILGEFIAKHHSQAHGAESERQHLEPPRKDEKQRQHQSTFQVRTIIILLQTHQRLFACCCNVRKLFFASIVVFAYRKIVRYYTDFI